METTGTKWFASLQNHVRKLRAEHPLPRREALSAAEEWQCRIIGGSLIRWLNDHGPRMLQERRMLARTMHVEEDPCIVFTSSVPGLVAAQEIIGLDDEGIVYLGDDEFEAWSKDHADDEYRWHVHVWSHFTESLPSRLRQEAQESFPLPEGHVYWLHAEGTMWGKLAGRGGDHLWQWDGEKPTLLEEALRTWVS